jgi:hypothetical protein
MARETEPAHGGPVSPPVALAFSAVAFVALAIAGLGIASLLLDADVIAVRGLGWIPGVVGMLLAVAGFCVAVWTGVRAEHPSYWTAPVAALSAYLGEVAGVVLGALLSGAGAGAALAAAGAVAAGWPGAVVAGAALVAGWGGVALVRTRAGRPRWPWERDDDEL